MKPIVRIDIVSDVMCPWCTVGFAGLSKALQTLDDNLRADIHWQPFELNPHMGPEGQNLREHLMQKYGSSAEDSRAARERITQMGAALGFEFNFTDDQRIVNTFNAHQLLHWAAEQGRQTELKMALFSAYFTHGRDVSVVDELVAIAGETGLNCDEALAVLNDQRFAGAVRAQQQHWQELGIHSVPAVILNERYLISGAQPPESYIRALTELLSVRN